MPRPAAALRRDRGGRRGRVPHRAGETYGLLGPNGAAPMVPGLDRQPLTFVTAQLDHRARRRRHASAGADRLAAAEREPGRPGDDLSRGALVEDIIYTIALTAIQARAT